MHFRIIQISTNHVMKDDKISDIDIYEDPLVLMETDYAGEELKYSEYIDYIKDELLPFATVNVKKKTIRFKSKKNVEREFLKAVDATIENFRDKLKKKQYWQAEYNLRSGVTEPYGIDDLFYHNNGCRKFSQIISDYLAGFIPQTIHIGSILDAHA